MRSPGLAALVADAAFITYEAQLQLIDLSGDRDWQVDLAGGQFTFVGEPSLEFPVQLLGSAAPGPRSWLWGWANPHGYPPAVLRAAEAARALGEQYSIPELTSGEVPFDAPENDPGDPPGNALSYDLSLAARMASRTWFGYRGPAGGGVMAWMLLEGLELDPPSAIRAPRIITEALTSTIITDHRRAVSSYAALRGLPWDGSRMVYPDGEVVVHFDAQDRISEISVTAGPA